MSDDRPTILALLGAYWPGHDAAGPNVSFRLLCESLADHFDFRVVARDRPFGAPGPLAESGRWQDLGPLRACYLPVGIGGAHGLGRLLRDTPHAMRMMNGFFDKEFTIPALVLARTGAIPPRPTLLAPRGEFAGGALALKGMRKKVYRRVARLSGLLRGVTLHATGEAERADIAAALPGRPVEMIANIRPLPPLPAAVTRPDGAPLRLAFVGRISPVKGLDVALAALALVRHPVRYTIYGPVSDAGYWQSCEAAIRALPPHVEVVHAGAIAHADIVDALAGHDLLFLPSRSENFGHAIFESLAAGTPVLIGDRTPWRDLAAHHAGYDLPSADPAGFARAIDHVAALPADRIGMLRQGARSVAARHVADSPARGDMLRLLMAMTR